MNRFLKRSCALILGVCLLMPLAGCRKTGPEKTLDDTAKALRDKDSKSFLAQIDINAFTYHELVNLRKDNSLLDLAGNLGSMFGLNNELEEMIMTATNLKEQYVSTFTRTVDSGEMMAMCARAATADCPWDPAGLTKAEVVKLDDGTAVARVTTSANITSWLALRREGEAWLIVGKAATRETAERFARDQSRLPRQEAPQEPVFPGTEPSGQGGDAEPGRV